MSENHSTPEGVTEITDDMMQKVEPIDKALVEAGLAQEVELPKTDAERVLNEAQAAPDTAEEAIAELQKEAAVTPEQVEKAAEEAVAEAREEIDLAA